MVQANQQRTLKTLNASASLTIEDITAEASKLAAFDNHEQIWCGRDADRGLTAIVAIHNTKLGPALGGTRLWPHSFEAAVTDALRLSRGMTYKSAVASLPLGGGKAVIIANAAKDKTPAMLAAYAEMLTALTGQFITAEDVGLSLDDADFLARNAPNVVGTTIGGSGNPSPFTASGVFMGIQAALSHRNGSDSLKGQRVAVQGLGSVGWALCEKLHEAGAVLTVTDLNTARTVQARQAFGAMITNSANIIGADVDIFAPCALGGIISAETIGQLKAGIIAGSANNQLALQSDGELLTEQNILYAPDYVINSGGLINAASEIEPGGYKADQIIERMKKIPATLTAIFERAAIEGRPTNDVAGDIALERINAGNPA